jgi:hypothetical protein
MSGYYPRGGSIYHGHIVDPNADQGSDAGWASSASARASRSAARSNEMPPGEQPQAKNAFEQTVMDGSITQEMLDCGYGPKYLDPMEPLYTGEPQAAVSKIRREKLDAKMDFHEVNEGFLERNNYMDRS